MIAYWNTFHQLARPNIHHEPWVPAIYQYTLAEGAIDLPIVPVWGVGTTSTSANATPTDIITVADHITPPELGERFSFAFTRILTSPGSNYAYALGNYFIKFLDEDDQEIGGLQVDYDGSQVQTARAFPMSAYAVGAVTRCGDAALMTDNSKTRITVECVATNDYILITALFDPKGGSGNTNPLSILGSSIKITNPAVNKRGPVRKIHFKPLESNNTTSGRDYGPWLAPMMGINELVELHTIAAAWDIPADVTFHRSLSENTTETGQATPMFQLEASHPHARIGAIEPTHLHNNIIAATVRYAASNPYFDKPFTQPLVEVDIGRANPENMSLDIDFAELTKDYTLGFARLPATIPIKYSAEPLNVQYRITY